MARRFLIMMIVTALSSGAAPRSRDIPTTARPVAARVLDAPFISDPPSGTLLRFVEAYAGSSSSEVRVVIVSASDQTLNQVAFSGGKPHTDEFVLTRKDGCDRGTFAPGDTCILYFKFQPLTAPGHPVTDYVDVFIGNQTFSYPLTASALYPLDVAPLKIDYGGVPVGLPVNRIVTVTNTSPVAIRGPGVILDIPLDSPFSAVSGLLPNTIPPGAGFDLTFRFEPRAMGVVSTPIGVTMFGREFTLMAAGCGVAAGQACSTATPTPSGSHGPPGHSGGSPTPGGGAGGGTAGTGAASVPPAPADPATAGAGPSPGPSGSVIAAVGGHRPASGVPVPFILLWVGVVLVLALATLLVWRWRWITARR